jgi:hypothetical protein
VSALVSGSFGGGGRVGSVDHVVRVFRQGNAIWTSRPNRWSKSYK